MRKLGVRGRGVGSGCEGSVDQVKGGQPMGRSCCMSPANRKTGRGHSQLLPLKNLTALFMALARACRLM